ncbi:MAG TPA: peptidylprolyl isomerase, partial [Gaiellaceae bacterium]|nr:peptidylprolyl isomerase [Gaiellaceae bacterium]
ITLDPRSAPQAAASFANLAKIGFFDGTSFHRIVPGFVIQGGDPTGTGSGGPGYTTVDKPPAGTRYPRGTVAMAKTAVEPPGTAGSQFFVVTQDAPLPPDYAVIGSVTDGMQTVERIEALGNRATELPRRPVVIDRMSLESG